MQIVRVCTLDPENEFRVTIFHLVPVFGTGDAVETKNISIRYVPMSHQIHFPTPGGIWGGIAKFLDLLNRFV